MNLNRLFSMLTRMVVRSAVDTGLKLAARKGRPGPDATPEDRAQANEGRGMARRMKQVARVTRRLWR